MALNNLISRAVSFHFAFDACGKSTWHEGGVRRRKMSKPKGVNDEDKKSDLSPQQPNYRLELNCLFDWDINWVCGIELQR